MLGFFALSALLEFVGLFGFCFVSGSLWVWMFEFALVLLGLRGHVASCRVCLSWLDFSLGAALAFLLLAWCLIQLDGPVYLKDSLLASCSWVLLIFFGLQSLLSACLGLLGLLLC